MKLSLPLFLLLLATPLLAGCFPEGPAPATADLQSWRSAVERYVADEGNGDLNILRDTTLPDARRGFAQMGNPAIPGASDANALLVGHPRLAGRPWFVYIVGILKKQSLVDIRVAALSTSHGSLVWRITPPNPAALRAYLAALAQTDSPRPMHINDFPAESDRFQLEVSADHLTVTHAESGAQWTLKAGDVDAEGRPIR